MYFDSILINRDINIFVEYEIVLSFDVSGPILNLKLIIHISQ